MKHYLIFGASRGLGAAFAAGLPSAGDLVWLISRSRPADFDRSDGIERIWIQVDLAAATAAEEIEQAIGERRIDVLLYNAGIWEKSAFSDRYDFERVTPAENHRILAVNLLAPIDCIQRLLPQVRRSENGKIILIGSTSGLDNIRAPEIAYNASKFGLRGLAQGLREITRPDHIGVTVINPGTITTEVPYEAGITAAAEAAPDGIPLADLVELARAVIATSRYSCVKEINVPSMRDPQA